MPVEIEIKEANGKKKEITDPVNLSYVKKFKRLMYPMGFWPGPLLGEKMIWLTQIPIWISPPLCMLYIVGGVYYIVKKYDEMTFPLMIELFISMTLSFLTMVRMGLPFLKQYHILFAKYFQEIHLIHYKDKGEFHNHTYKTVHTLSRRFTNYMVVLMWAALLLFNVPTAYNNYRTGAFSKSYNYSREFSLKFLMPGFDPQDHFYLVSATNLYCSYCCGVSLVLVDLLMSLMVFNMIGHIKILVNDIKELSNLNVEEDIIGFSSSDTVCKLFDKKTNDLITERLKMCVDYHRFIVKMASEISEFFGPVLGINYLIHLISCCLLLFECSLPQTDAVVQFGVLTVTVFGQLVQTSVIFEFIGTVSENLSFELYAVPWEQMNILNRRIIHVMLLKMQEPINVYAIGTVKVGLRTMTEILKTTFSYYMFLTSKNGYTA